MSSDMKNISYDNFLFWFLPALGSTNCWEIIDKSTGEYVGLVSNNTITVSEENEGIKDSIMNLFRDFQERPEYTIADPIEAVELADQETLIAAYEKKIEIVCMIRAARAGKNPDQCTSSASRCIDWLRSTDFYNAPASTQYHDSCPAGLLRHSIRVFNHGVRLMNDKAFSSVTSDSIGLVALVHDWCKINLYEVYTRNVKNQETGVWEQVPSYRCNQKGLPLGHGVTSMFFASKFFRLTSEEAAAIRWHMGVWNVSNNEVNELQLCNEQFPLVHLLQFSDCLSITNYAN